MMHSPDTTLRVSANNLAAPIMVGGVKLMSYGFVKSGAAAARGQAAVLRGPIVSGLVNQLATGTDWALLVCAWPQLRGVVWTQTCNILQYCNAQKDSGRDLGLVARRPPI